MGLLNLSRPVEFEGVSPVTAVFYDDNCGHVFSVRGGGVTGVVVKSMTNTNVMTQRLATDSNSSGSIVSIKLSPNLSTLSVQRSVNTVTFIPVSGTSSPGDGQDTSSQFCQMAKSKQSAVLGFVWTSNTELVYITDSGIEIYSINQEKRHVKYVRHVSDAVSWYCHVSGHVLLTSATADTDQVTVWSVRAGNIVKLTTLSLTHSVKDKDVKMLTVYDVLYISVFVKQESSIHLYSVKNDTVSWSHVLTDVDSDGVIGLHTLDNIILVHSKSQSRSKFYDLQISQPHPDHPNIQQVSPPVPPASICSHDGSSITYSPNWVVFLPNILVDARNGKMWSVNMKLVTNNLPAVTSLTNSNLITVVNFLLNRAHGKTPLINLLKSCVSSRTPLTTVREIFTCIVTAYTCHQQHVAHDGSSGYPTSCTGVRRSVGGALGYPPSVILDQPDIFTNVLNTFNKNEVSDRFLLAVVVEYIHALVEQAITPRQFVYELLINLCVRTNRLYQLHQMLQYQVISDSKPVACLLLSLESVYPSSRQMALDMMARLGTATQEIAEILLAQGQVVAALNYVSSNGGMDTVSARKFLEAAEVTNDNMVFYNVFSFFEERNLRLRGSPNFSPSDQCDKYVSKYKELFLL